MGLRDTIRQGAQAIMDATGIGKESFTQDFLTKLGNSKEILDLYFEGKIEHNDPNLVHAVTTLASTVGSAGLASAPLRTNSLGVFGGLGALKRSDKQIGELMTRLEKALPEEEITKLTGLWKGPEGKWRYEIPDDKAKVDYDLLKTLPQYLDDMTKKRGYKNEVAWLKLGDVLGHAQLYEAYPELKKVTLSYDSSLNTRKSKTLTAEFWGAGGWDPEGKIVVGPKFLKLSPEEQKQTLLHEIQHSIQEKEGFLEGTNVEDAGSFKAYWDAPGEREARNIEKRDELRRQGKRVGSAAETDLLPDASVLRNKYKYEQMVQNLSKYFDKGNKKMSWEELKAAVIADYQ